MIPDARSPISGMNLLPPLIWCFFACFVFQRTAVCAQTGAASLPVVYSEDFDDGRAPGWELEPGWSVDRSALFGKEHHWARYERGRWENLNLTFRFNVWNRGMHANVRVSATGRYAVGFGVENDRIHVRIFKELWNVQPTVFRDLAQRQTRFQLEPQGLQGTIVVNGGTIQVYINERLVSRARDPNPLPAGSIAFETLAEGFAQIDNIVVRAERELIKVPDVIGRPLEVARERIGEAGLMMGELGERSADAAPGTVIEQRPRPGSEVVPETPIALLVSSGPGMVEVPGLTGLKRNAAVGLLRTAGLVLGTVRNTTSDAEPETVVEQEPPPGTRVAPRTAVHIRIAAPFPSTRVPDLLGLKLEKARVVLQRANLRLGGVTRELAGGAAGTVLHQEPAAGTQVPPESGVSIVIAKKPEVSWVFPSIGAGVFGFLLGYWVRSRKGGPRATIAGHPPTVTISVRKDNGEQGVEPTEDLTREGHIRFKVVADAGEQRLESQGPLVPQDEGDHDD